MSRKAPIGGRTFSAINFEIVCAGTENRDSGVADVEVCSYQCQCAQNQALGGSEFAEEACHDTQIKRSALSNSLLDIHEQCKLLALDCQPISNFVSVVAGEKAQRRGSVGSLDSGMSVSFQSTSASTCSRSDKLANKGKAGLHNHQSFLGGLFNKKPNSVVVKSTEV